MSIIEEIVDKATDKCLTCEDWNSIIELCDLAKNGRSREIINCLKKKIMDQNSNTILYALTISDSLVKNCTLKVHREISSRGFLDVLVKQLKNKKIHEVVKEKILFLIQQWSITFKYDSSLSYCNEVYEKLKRQNYKFVAPKSKEGKENIKNTENSEELKEKEDLQLALALSLSTIESNKSNSSKTKVSKFSPPDSVVLQHSQPNKPLFKVKALYDFLGNYAEGELSLYRGDIVDVYDTTFKDWWKGENRGMIGIFPNNYVEKISDSSNFTQINNEYENQVLKDAQKIDEFMQILATIDPKTENLSENEELQDMYNSICTLRPKLVKLVEYYSKKKEESALLTSKFLQAQTTYQNLANASLMHNQQNYSYDRPVSQVYYQPPPPTQPYQTEANQYLSQPQLQQPQSVMPPQPGPYNPQQSEYMNMPTIYQPQNYTQPMNNDNTYYSHP